MDRGPLTTIFSVPQVSLSAAVGLINGGLCGSWNYEIEKIDFFSLRMVTLD